jgi:hypothetical protein
MIESKFKIVEADSPKRCQGIGGQSGQCRYEHVEGSKFCPMHGGQAAVNAKNEATKRLYRLQKWQDRVSHIADHDKIKSLREEIGILRVVLEEIWNSCNDSQTLILNSSKIADLTTRLEKLVSSCHRLETSTGMLLDKGAALHIASVIIGIISDFVSDAEAIDQISHRIVTVIASAGGAEVKND